MTSEANPCPSCGSKSIQVMSDGEREPAPHVRDEFHTPDRRCAGCGERWNPSNRPVSPPVVMEKLGRFAAVVVVAGSVLFTVSLGLVALSLRFGDLGDAERAVLEPIVSDPIGTLGARYLAVVMSPLFAIPAGLLFVSVLFYLGLAARRAQTRFKGGDHAE